MKLKIMEQNAFHQNLMQMRETARASILSLRNNGGGRGDYTSGEASDESHTPLHSGPKGSGLRNYLGDDGDESMMHGGKSSGRF